MCHVAETVGMKADNVRQIQETWQSYLSGEALSNRNMLVTSVILIFNSHILRGLKRWNKVSVQFSHSVVSDSSRPHEPQHTRPPCPSPTPGVYSNPCPLSQWCHLAISFSVVPFSSCPQSFPASGSFQISQLFTSGGQSIGASASISVLPMNTQSFRMDWLDLLAVQGSQESSPTPQFKSINFSVVSFLHSATLTSIHDHWKKP